jgi:hypothetical protein
MQQEFPWKPLFRLKELTQIIMVPRGYQWDGKGVDDADKTALSPMNLITEVHKIGL